MRTHDELFELFWKAYPRRVAKKAAHRAFLKIEPDEELLTLMLRALQWQTLQWTEFQYVPYPATWLNGRRWEDENPDERRNKRIQSIKEVLAEMMGSPE